MVGNDEDRFRIKPGAPKSRAGPRSQRFVSQVLKQVSKAGAKTSGKSLGRSANTFGRGRVAASMAGRGLGPNARRVIIKSRFVVLRRASPNSVAVHLRYIERDGVTRDGQKGQAYGADTDTADLKAFQDRGQSDRHQFRFIVSAENALELEDLKGFTRQLMHRIEIDLETRLDWVAVDHWDTDNPHTHIVLNGHTGGAASGKEDLIIAPDYMAHGMRLRASEIATEWLGPRTEAEIGQSLQREVTQQRLTGLDRALLRHTVANAIDLTGEPGDRQRHNMLRARLERLEAMALAERVDANRWSLAPDMARILTTLGEREEALDTMRRALKGLQREFVIEEILTTPVIGRIASKGLVDELHDRGYLVVDGIDGRGHYLKLPVGVDLVDLPVGGIVEVKLPVQERVVDRNILAAAKDGIYSTFNYRAGTEQAMAEIHTRRLEALRRSGIVGRVADGIWAVPPDFLLKAQQHDAKRATGLSIELRSQLAIERQISAVGVTWLDRRLVVDADATAPQPPCHGFGAQVREAMDKRVDFLAGQGLAERQGKRVILARNLLSTLRDRELAAAGPELQKKTGKTWRPVQHGQHASGVYRQSVQLVSGRFAMLEDSMNFQLVPWKPVIEQRLGQPLSALVRGSSVTWNLGHQRGASR